MCREQCDWSGPVSPGVVVEDPAFAIRLEEPVPSRWEAVEAYGAELREAGDTFHADKVRHAVVKRVDKFEECGLANVLRVVNTRRILVCSERTPRP